MYTLVVDLPFSEKFRLQQADATANRDSTFFTLRDISCKYDVKEKMGSRCVVGKYKKNQVPLSQKNAS